MHQQYQQERDKLPKLDFVSTTRSFTKFYATLFCKFSDLPDSHSSEVNAFPMVIHYLLGIAFVVETTSN